MVAPVLRTSSAYLAVSERMRSAKACGVDGNGVKPKVPKRSRTSGSPSARFTSRLIVATAAVGVAFGTRQATQAFTSQSVGPPDRAAVGTSGAAASRDLAATPTNFTFPART